MLDALFVEAGVLPRDLSAIGFAAGPGSFTGIRISAAVCQALAVGAGARVVPLSSSRLLAEAARRTGLLESARGVQTLLRSRRNYAYLAEYSATLDCLADDVLHEDSVLCDTPAPDGYLRVMDASADEAAELSARPLAVRVADLLVLVSADLKAGRDLPPAGAQPRYVEGDTPWVPQRP